jgi:hypothetical protein
MTVGDGLLDAVPRQHAGVPLRGDHRREPALPQPSGQPPDFGAQDPMIRQFAEQRLERVEHHPAGAHALDRIRDADEQAVEIVLAGLCHLGARDMHVVEEELLLRDQSLEIEAERRGVHRQVRDRLLERDEHARLPVQRRAADEEFQREHRLARAGAAADERRASDRQAAFGDLVKPLNAAERFCQPGRAGCGVLASGHECRSFAGEQPTGAFRAMRA